MAAAGGLKFFNPAKKGEIFEMQRELESNKVERQKAALKSVIAAMTIGKDVSMLFPNVVKCIHTSDLDLKKLVYLYVMNYAKSHPDLAILAVNQFVKDATNPNPLVKALAIRTMGCIRIAQITEYLYQPLKECLKDTDPYVRKTAAICVAKIYDISPESVVQQGFIDILIAMLGDSNPMVVSNSLASLMEVNEIAGEKLFAINPTILVKLLSALNECTEWGQTTILNALATYNPQDSREAESIAERVTSRLQHSNSGVVLGAIRMLLHYITFIKSPEVTNLLLRKMSGPLVTMLSKEPEIQYVALRNIGLVLQKLPDILQYEIKVFFCKYNDPIYVKMEKLEIIIMLSNDKNIDQVLMEFKEYATAADVEFVRRAVRAIGRCAIKLESAAERCIHVLLELIESGFDPVIQESIIVIKDIFRKYPNRYESIIGKLCKNLSNLDEPQARSAMIWIIGEYADRIGNAPDLLFGFLTNFLDEPVDVQLQLLTATVKLFLKRTKSSTKKMVSDILELAANECDHPDVRDRGIMYWRLLSDSKAAKSVVLGDKPLITDDTSILDPRFLDELLDQISSVSSVYHKPPDTFVRSRKAGAYLQKIKEAKERESQEAEEEEIGVPPVEPLPNIIPVSERHATPIVDLLTSVYDQPVQSAPAPQQPPSLFGAPTPAAPAPVAAPAAAPAGLEETEHKVLLPANEGDGMQVLGSFVMKENKLGFKITIQNQSPQPLSGFVIQMNVNAFNIAPAAPLQMGPVAPGQSSTSIIPLAFNGPPCQKPSPFLQIGLKNNVRIYKFQDVLPFKLLFVAEGKLPRGDYIQTWKSLSDPSQETSIDVAQLRSNDHNQVMQVLDSNNIFYIAARSLQDRHVLYHSARIFGVIVLVELAFMNGGNGCKVCIRSSEPKVLPKLSKVVEGIIAK